MSDFYAKFLPIQVDDFDESNESYCGENTRLTVSSFFPLNKQKKEKTDALSALIQVLQGFVMYFISWHCFLQLYPAVEDLLLYFHLFVLCLGLRYSLWQEDDVTNAKVKGYVV